MLKNIYSILEQGEKRRFAILIFWDIVISVLDILFLVLLLYVINFYSSSVPPSLPSWAPASLIDKYPLLLITVFFFLFCIKNLLSFVLFNRQFQFMYGVALRLSKKNITNYLNDSYSNYIDIDSSVHSHIICHQPLEFCSYILGNVQLIINQSILVLIAVIAILIFNPVLFLLLLLILTPPVIIGGLLLKKKMLSLGNTAKTAGKTTLQHLQESLSSFVESNIYQQKDFFINRYYNYQKRFNKFLSDQRAIQNVPPKLIEVFAIFGLFILILVNKNTGSDNSTQLITLGTFMAAAYKIIPGIVKITNAIGQVKTYAYTLTDLLKESDQKKKELAISATAITSIQFNAVAFSYKNKSVLNQFSLTVQKGDFIGLQGSSGSGKTTIINLLLGFLEPDAGEIKVNDIVTTGTERQQYWDKISYVKQQTFLLHDSIWKNIALNENYDKEKMAYVTSITGIDAMISQMPDGVEAIISENGKNISGGQRQRIAIARALYKEAELFILDEPFNELDEESEFSLIDIFKQLSQRGKTVILITHNKKALSSCSKLISL